jgi:hypothetical protein
LKGFGVVDTTESSLRITGQHLQKLEDLHARRSGSKSPSNLTFKADLFCLLERYRSIKGGGFQAAMPGTAFEVLREDFGAAFECFASPLNCRYGSFCSAFPDTDGPFGSVGSFFSFHPLRGSFQANPPFVPTMIGDMCSHMTSLLVAAEAAGEALAFVIVVGASGSLKSSPAWTQLTTGADTSAGSAARFVKHHLVVRLQDHRYKEGNQHMKKSGKKRGQGERMSSCDTSVLFWQTTAASQQWPVNDDKLARLQAAFRH